jgi:4-hydroxyphenylacetate 3-monooxygenase
MDAVVFFDDVLVPWERVFLLGDVDLVNDTAVATHSHIHTAHQGAAKNVAKSELALGVALLMAETLGSTQVPHVQERLAELMTHTEVMKASLRAAEADAQIDRWGVMCPAGLPLEVIRTLFMNVYPRMVEILQLLGSSSFMIIPAEPIFRVRCRLRLNATWLPIRPPPASGSSSSAWPGISPAARLAAGRCSMSVSSPATP